MEDKEEKPYFEKSKEDEKFSNLVNNLPKPLDAFKSLHAKDSGTFRLMKSYGSKIAPLAVVG